LALSSHIQAPLTELLKDVKENDPSKIEWTSELHASFEACKQSIADAALLSFPALKSELQLACDASDFAIGAVLEQRTHGNWQPLGFFSMKLSCSLSSNPLKILNILLTDAFLSSERITSRSCTHFSSDQRKHHL